MTEVVTAPAPAPTPAAPEPAPVMHATIDSWVAERHAKRAAAEPARGERGQFVSKNPQPEAAPVEEAPEAEQSEADTQAADDATGEPLEANPEGENAAPPEPIESAIEPPQFWDAEGKEAFAKLSPASQKEVLAYEKQRTAAVAKAMQKSTEAAKAAEAKLTQLREIVDRFGEQREPAEERMEAWKNWFRTEGKQLALTNKEAFDAEKGRYEVELIEFNENLEKRTLAERTLYSEHIKEQNRLLPELAPELADPKEGKQRFADTMKYLRDAGYESDTLKWISAKDLSFAHKAMLWDRAQARAKEAPKPKPKPAGPTAAPAGQGQRASSSEAQLKALQSKSNLTQDEFMTLQRLKRK